MVVNSLFVGQLGEEGSSGHTRGAALGREHLRLAQTRPAELQSALAPLLDVIAGHVREAIRQGLFRQADPQLHARLVCNLVSTTLHTMLLQEEGGVSSREDR